MLSAEKNRLLTQVGAGTPMGDYLRRYWMPIGGAAEFDTNPIKAIRLASVFVSLALVATIPMVVFVDFSGLSAVLPPLTIGNCVEQS